MRFQSLMPALAGLSLVLPTSVLAQAGERRAGTERQSGFYAEALAGQNVAVLPVTMIRRDTAIPDPVFEFDRKTLLSWADSVLGEALLDGEPAVNWVLPPELRRHARRAAGFIPDPDRMGQAVMRNPELKQVPDPLRSNLRTLMAIAGGRYAFIPAMIEFTLDEEGAVKATLHATLADSRLGSIQWRAEAVGAGPDATSALGAALTSVLPSSRTTP